MGRSAIFYAIMSEKFAMLKYVAHELPLDAIRAELNRQDRYGVVPLYYAVKSCSLDVVLYCLELGEGTPDPSGSSKNTSG